MTDIPRWEQRLDSYRKAFEMGLISDGQTWMDMIRSRNETSHNYNGDIANGVIENIIGRFYPCMTDFLYKMNHYCPRKTINISKSNNLIVTHQN